MPKKGIVLGTQYCPIGSNLCSPFFRFLRARQDVQDCGPYGNHAEIFMIGGPRAGDDLRSRSPDSSMGDRRAP